ncbi:MAG: hydrogenase maturation nickel metallochaperone HypA [Pirellulaceae bacterium]|nr:hydrogenase maturation nickel metallochaperone HypA [Pirellulaceae bacterium]
MHEFSLAQALLRQVGQVHALHPDTEIAAVCVQVGPLSGVEDCLLQSAFQQCTLDEYGRQIELIVERVSLSVECQHCGRSATLEKANFICPHCSSRQLRVTGGDSLILVSVDLHSVSPTGAFS